MIQEQAKFETLISEIKQITEQYNAEVGRPRKTWPESVRTRVIELRRLGYNLAELSKATDIPYYTMMNWFHRGHRLSAGDFKAVTVTAANPKQELTVQADSGRGITITLADRVKIEGLEFKQVMSLLKRMRV